MNEQLVQYDHVTGYFESQDYLRSIGALLVSIQDGECVLQLPVRADLLDRHAFFHGAVVGALAESAGALAGLTLLDRESSLLTFEYKINFLERVVGLALIATGIVVTRNDHILAVRASVESTNNGQRTLCAQSIQSMICRENCHAGEEDVRR